jgi:glycosyltransferase involved in cell wall biosynthesis
VKSRALDIADAIDLPLLPTGFTLLQITPELEGGGVEHFTLDLAGAVARAGGRSLVASRGGGLEAALRACGGELIRLPVHSKNPVVISANARRLAKAIRKNNVNVAHVHSRAPAFSALWAARATGTPLAATYHGAYSGGSKVKRWYNSVMTKGDLVIVHSIFMRDHVIAEHGLPPEKILLVPGCVDTAHFDAAGVDSSRIEAIRNAWGLAPADRRPVVLLAGRLTRGKGHLLAIEAVAALAKPERPLLVFVGGGRDNDYRAQIRSAAARAGISDQLRLAGPTEDMPAAYLAADLVIAPSEIPEAFGRTVVEAGAMRRVVLAAAHGGAAETVADGETGWLVAPGSVGAWRAAIEVALRATSEQGAVIGQAARGRMERLHSIPAMSEAMFAGYRRLVEQRSTRRPG